LVYGGDGDLVAELAEGSRQHLGTFLLFSGTHFAAVLVSLPAYSHPRPLPSKLSRVRQSPPPSSLPPSVEAAECTRKGYTPSRATIPLETPREWRDTDWFKTRVPDQTQKRPHFIQSVNRPSPSTLHQRTATTQPHFHVNGWALGPCVTQNLRTSCRYRPCLSFFKGSHDLISNWGCERLGGSIRHDRDALARRAHLTNHRNRNAIRLHGPLDRVSSVWRGCD
jgi:hypothetical protein